MTGLLVMCCFTCSFIHVALKSHGKMSMKYLYVKISYLLRKVTRYMHDVHPKRKTKYQGYQSTAVVWSAYTRKCQRTWRRRRRARMRNHMKSMLSAHLGIQ